MRLVPGVPIGVLMPVKDGERTVRSAVLSTLMALSSRSVLYVFDDGSSDSTPEVLRSISDIRLRVFRIGTSIGVAAALNHLLDVAQEPYLARMDADDYCLPWRFKSQLRALQNDDDMCFGSVINVGGSLAACRPSLPIRLSPDAVRVGLLVENVLAHSSMLVRRSVISNFRYRNGPAEDYELWLRMLSQGVRIRRIGVPVIGYRNHPGQVTRELGWKERFGTDARLRSAYEELAHQIGWRGHDLFDVINGGAAGSTKRRTSYQFIAKKLDDLSSLQRHWILRRLRKRMGIN